MSASTRGAGVVPLGSVGAGQWVGELGMLLPGSANASVTADQDTRVRILTHSDYAKLRDSREAG